MAAPSIAVLYEHPQWFKPLFAELDKRNVGYDKIHINDHYFDPGEHESAYSLVVNRISAYPSTASVPRVVLYVKQYLAFLEHIGTRVINGWRAYAVGTSKALQMSIFKKLGLDAPASRVIHDVGQAAAAAAGLRYPVLIKPNVGGSGAGIVLFNTPDELAQSAAAGRIDLGIDQVALVQEYLKPKDDCIYRVEILNDALLYGIRLPILQENFNYCPADGCNIEPFDHCPLGESSTSGTAITAFDPSAEVIEKVKAVIAESGADLGGVEYLVNAADGRPYFYDINPLSNFVADPVSVVGFDPIPRFVDFILAQTG